MHERDLRRVALESGKTMSKKAKAKQMSARSSVTGSARNSPMSSPMISPNGSKMGSRAGSHYGGSDSGDDDSSSDGMAESLASLDLLGSHANEFADATPHEWQHKLSDCVENIIERARSTKTAGEAREEMLAVYSSILQVQCAADEISPKIRELIPAILKSCKTGEEREAILALQALNITAVTTGEVSYREIQSAVKIRASDTSSDLVQAAALHSLGLVAAFGGGAGGDEIEDLQDYMLEVVRTDGDSVSAHDSIPVVAAALQQWGLLATFLGEMEDTSPDSLEVFEDQLDSSDAKVQIAAGQNIALLFEKSFSPRDDDEDPDVDPEDEEANDQYEYGDYKRKKWIQRYQIDGHSSYNLRSKLNDLSRVSGRHIAKDSRKDLHKSFRDILHTVDHPWRGPKFSTALNEDQTFYTGHRVSVRQGKDSAMPIDRWWKLIRYEALKRVLGGGFTLHLRVNDVVADALPWSLEAPNDL